MTLVLNNEQIEDLLSVADCLEPLRSAYLDLARGHALNRARSDLYAKHELPGAFYVFKSMEGLLAREKLLALRLNSDVIEWSRYAGGIRKDKLPLAEGGRFVGLILLFSTETGEPVAVVPDGVLQRLRVGASNALAADIMARRDASVYALIGSGWQAGAQLEAMAAVRQLEEVRVFSPNADRRASFVEQYRGSIPGIRAVGSVGEAVEGAHIVGCATSAVRPVLASADVRSGMHLTCVRVPELGQEVLDRCARVVVHAHDLGPINHSVGSDVQVVGNDPIEVGADGTVRYTDASSTSPNASVESAWSGDESTLADILGGHAPGRGDDDEINAFVNNVGAGIQFASLAGLVVERAREAGVGQEIPTDWLTESEHP